MLAMAGSLSFATWDETYKTYLQLRRSDGTDIHQSTCEPRANRKHRESILRRGIFGNGVG